jgi:Spy/CpxP family protein refolding chaperone
MNKLSHGLIVAVLAAATVFGQANEQEGARKARAAFGRGNWVGKRIMTPEFLEKIGVKGEQAAKLKAQSDEIEKQSQKVEEEITKAAMEQAEIAKKVLAEPGASTDEMMALIEKIGKLRTEQAKLATQRLIIMRDNLTPEQRQKASAALNEEQKKWREEREAREKAGGANHPANQTRRPAAPKNW